MHRDKEVEVYFCSYPGHMTSTVSMSPSVSGSTLSLVSVSGLEVDIEGVDASAIQAQIV